MYASLQVEAEVQVPRRRPPRPRLLEHARLVALVGRQAEVGPRRDQGIDCRHRHGHDQAGFPIPGAIHRFSLLLGRVLGGRGGRLLHHEGPVHLVLEHADAHVVGDLQGEDVALDPRASAWAKSSESTEDSFAKAGRSNRGGRLLQPVRRPVSSSFRNESSSTSCVFSGGKARGTIPAGPRRKVKVPPVCWLSSPSTAARASSPSALAVEIARTTSPLTKPNSRSTPSRSMNRSPVLAPWDIIPKSSVGWTARSSPQRTATSSGARKSRTRWCCGLFAWLTALCPRAGTVAQAAGSCNFSRVPP